MNLIMIDETEAERILYVTPLLTPHVSESNASDYSDLDCSFSQRDFIRRMSGITRDLQQAANICSQLVDNESESDMQDQHPTEATDDSNDPSQIQVVTPNITNSFHSQPIKEQEINNLSSVLETEVLEDSFSSIVSDAETIQIAVRHEQQSLEYSISLCVPYTDAQEGEDEVAVIKDTLTSTSTISVDFTEIVKKDKEGPRHIMISYNHSTKAVCSKIAKYLKNRNYIVWIDQDNISGDILTSMASAVENSFVVLMAINEQYHQSRYCRLEAEYSVEQNKPSIPMMMQTGYRPSGWLGIINGSKLHIDFSQLPFEEAFNLLLREIEAIRTSSGIGLNDRTVAISSSNQITTTTTTTTVMDNSWSHFQNVHEWTTDDVIEWLNREKLDMFEESLRYFTGATLWQLYKVKLDSPPDYYRMVETMLPPFVPLRLVHNLRFYAALESLFSSLTQSFHR